MVLALPFVSLGFVTQFRLLAARVALVSPDNNLYSQKCMWQVTLQKVCALKHRYCRLYIIAVKVPLCCCLGSENLATKVALWMVLQNCAEVTSQPDSSSTSLYISKLRSQDLKNSLA